MAKLTIRFRFGWPSPEFEARCAPYGYRRHWRPRKTVIETTHLRDTVYELGPFTVFLSEGNSK